MKQLTFASAAYSAKKKTTNQKTGPKGGRPPIGLARMLRVWCLQQWFALSDPGMGEALYDMESMRRFAGFELGEDAIPDETTILNFRRLLETHKLTDRMFALVRELLEAKGLLLKSGTRVDAILIAAPPSTKNAEGKHDLEMTPTKKGDIWHFGMKVHIGADNKSGLIHTVRMSTAKVADCAEAEQLLHGQEERVFGDRGCDYPRVHQTIERIGALDGAAIRRTAGITQSEAEALFNRVAAKVRSRVEHPFRVLKRQFGYIKVRYHGLAKNSSQIIGLFALINLYIARRQLMPQGV
ncbi:IS5 family transposase [Pseudothauera rhizosphaerae]|uniref:IS5 family transposase n=1 Tax=Pseudothauera rhizosphaerae TaxID=2565932 RepID=A0A4S4ABC5_9RHOO|nr:IS5 family transposase [Pseudothauera rhizosphaerae]THF56235.1 IS5 family transposase [Pseudothauera rhizosphaerae]